MIGPDLIFNGRNLPDSRTINAKGFTAKWHMLYYNRPFPQQWVNDNKVLQSKKALTEAVFGVKLQVPVDQYKKVMRTAKYSTLIILLTFISLFLAELIRKDNVHVFNYTLVGAAMVVYYILLLSFSEQIGYNYAYLLSSASTIALISIFHSISSQKQGCCRIICADTDDILRLYFHHYTTGRTVAAIWQYRLVYHRSHTDVFFKKDQLGQAMKFYSLFYSLKVWLSSVFLAPLIYLFIQWWLGSKQISSDPIFKLYPIMVFFELIFSFFIWAIFWGIIEISGVFLINKLIRKWLIFISSIILAASTSLVLCWPVSRHSFNDIFFDVGICNCVCIGAGCWFFKLGPARSKTNLTA